MHDRRLVSTVGSQLWGLTDWVETGGPDGGFYSIAERTISTQRVERRTRHGFMTFKVMRAQMFF